MIAPFFAVVKKELASVIRDRTIVIAIMIQLFIASFSSALLLGMLSLYDSDTIMQYAGSRIKIAVVGPSDNPLESFLIERGLKVTAYATLQEADAAFLDRKANAIVVIPQEETDTAQVKLYLPNSDAFSSLIRMVIQEPLKRYENYLRAQRGIEVRYADLKGKPSVPFEFIYSVLLPMLMFFPAFISGSMSVDSLTEEVENNTLQTLLSAPLTINGMIGAKIVASVILSVAQCVAWRALLRLNGSSMEHPAWILLLAAIIAGIASTLAVTCAALLKDRERSQFIYSLALLALTAISTILNISPITTISRLAVGDAYTNGWNVAIFDAFLVMLGLVLTKVSRRMMA